MTMEKSISVPKIKAIIDELQEAGITIVDGTH